MTRAGLLRGRDCRDVIGQHEPPASLEHEGCVRGRESGAPAERRWGRLSRRLPDASRVEQAAFDARRCGPHADHTFIADAPRRWSANAGGDQSAQIGDGVKLDRAAEHESCEQRGILGIAEQGSSIECDLRFRPRRLDGDQPGSGRSSSRRRRCPRAPVRPPSSRRRHRGGRGSVAEIGWLAPHRRRRAACRDREGHEKQGAHVVPRLAGGRWSGGRCSGGAEANHLASMRRALTGGPTAADLSCPQSCQQDEFV
jgi:hypothetical protein